MTEGTRDALEQDRPYARVARSELITRDVLAIDRTVLANERTLLAYARTALAFLVAGVSLLHFFDMVWVRLLGIAMIPVAPVVMAVGVRRFRRVHRDLKALK